MTANVATASLNAKNQAAFALVFNKASLARPPPQHYQYEYSAAHVGREVREQLGEDSYFATGLNDERFVLPAKDPRHAFAPHFFTCPSMTVVEKPSAEDRVVFLSRLLQLPSFAKASAWTARIGIDALKKTFAAVIDKLITEFVHWAYAGTYNEEVRQHLNFWVEHVLLEYIKLFLHAVSKRPLNVNTQSLPSTADVEKYQARALSRLWALRADELFDMVVDWDDTVAGIDDLKPFLKTPEARQYVSDRFANALQTRLLHPGASTIEILQIYISIIRAFRRLDPKGVLLSKVSGRVRQYLRERDDTVKVVVAGLLADMSLVPTQRTAEQMNPDILTELAWELQNRDPNAEEGSSSLDWNNMNWQPDPIDAAPEHLRSSRQSDVIGSVISLFESKDVFVKELQVMLAERLLRNKDDYDQEISVLEHLKIRFGDAALQACEVMLRDVLDSRRLDQTIRRDQGLDANEVSNADDTTEVPELHAKILSRLFWPSLPGSTPAYGEEDRQFKPPLHILHHRNLYEQGFENLKQTRKLTWNDNVGQVDIELTFADGRIYHDEVLPYQAGVLYAFNDDSEDASATQGLVSKSVSELSDELGLSTTLTRSACLLFVSKRVLTPHVSKPDTFTVLEHLPPPPGTAGAIDTGTHQQTAPLESGIEIDSAAAEAAAQAQAQSERAAELAAQQAIKEAEAKEKRAKMAVYQQFITAMLTNQGSMPLPRIAMMLGMVVPGGFPFSNEELRDFLGGMVREGIIELNGSNYKKL